MSSDLLTRMLTIMEQYDISPFQLTKEFGVSSSSFTDWKKGKGTPSLSFLEKFSVRFNVSLDYLVFGKPNASLEISNTDQTLLDKFHALSSDGQKQLLGYIDGMLSVLSSGTTQS